MTMENTKSHVRVAFLGCGSMGTALLQGFSSASKTEPVPEHSYAACVRSPQSSERSKDDLAAFEAHVEVGIDGVATASGADVVLLGCQPQELDASVSSDGSVRQSKEKLIVSMLAGVSSADVSATLVRCSGEEATQGDFQVARIIPSIGARIGDSVSSVADSPVGLRLNQDQTRLLDTILGRVGVVQHVPERLMDEATAIGAVCHALSMVANDAIADASVAQGVPRSIATVLAAQSLRSSNASLVNAMTPESLKAAMSTPCGITINAVLQLESGGARAAISNAVQKGIQYAKNMG